MQKVDWSRQMQLKAVYYYGVAHTRLAKIAEAERNAGDHRKAGEARGFFVCLSVCLSVSMSVCLSVSLSVCACVCTCGLLCVRKSGMEKSFIGMTAW
jgi:hypothetical protein